MFIYNSCFLMRDILKKPTMLASCPNSNGEFCNTFNKYEISYCARSLLAIIKTLSKNLARRFST